MSDDFAINYISIMHGRYIFHNGMVTKRLEEISELQILEYLHDTLEQAKQASAALLAKQNNNSSIMYEISVVDNHGKHCIKVPKIEISHLMEMEAEDAERILCNLPESEINRLKKEIIELGKTNSSCLFLLNYFLEIKL